MSKITLSNVADITQSTTAQTTINSNSAVIQNAMDNTLSRDGTSPNQMNSTLDMNSNQVINLPAPATVNSPARLGDVTGVIVPSSSILGGNNVYTGNNSFNGTSNFIGAVTLPSTFPTLAANQDWLGNNFFHGITNFPGPAAFTNTVTLPANSVPNSELAQMSANTIKGNNTGGAANAADLTPAQVNTLLATSPSPLLSSNNIWTGSNAIQNGLPWCDVLAWGADRTGATDCSGAVQNAINFLNATLGHTLGGIVFFPPGNYLLTNGLVVKGGVRLVGSGQSATSIGNWSGGGGAYAGPYVIFDSSSANAGIENMNVTGYIGGAPTQATITVANGKVVNMTNVTVTGGTLALSTGGTDGCMLNCYFQGYTDNVFSTGANNYIRCKIDSQLGTTSNAFLQGISFNGAVQENHFSLCDFSGTFTNSVTISDGGFATAISTFEGCVFSAPIVITSGKYSMFSACEIGGNAFTVGTNPTAITGCVNVAGGTLTVSGAGKVLAGCIGIV